MYRNEKKRFSEVSNYDLISKAHSNTKNVGLIDDTVLYALKILRPLNHSGQ